MNAFLPKSTPLIRCRLAFIALLALSFLRSMRVLAAHELPSTSLHYILVDSQSGQVIAASRESEPAEPASLTKLMTMYVVSSKLRAGKIKLMDAVQVSQKASWTEGSRMFIEASSTVVVEDLIRGIIVHSGNDASVAMAEYVSGKESAFVALMNRSAQRLGMSSTNFMNASGLPIPRHYTTAFDIALLVQALISDFPEYYPWYSQKSFTFNRIQQVNRNRLLWLDRSVDGLKTGLTVSAGYCLAASAVRMNRRLIAVVMGAASKLERVEVAQALFNYGFNESHTKKLYQKGDAVQLHPVWGGRSAARIGVAKDVYVTLGCTNKRSVKRQITLYRPLVAPLSKEEVVGELQVFLGNEHLTAASLVLLEKVEVAKWITVLKKTFTGLLWDWY